MCSKNLEDTYLGNLPNEILSRILSFISTIDLNNFCEAFEQCNYFFQEREVIKHLNLSRGFTLKTLKPITQKLGYELVHTLNINFVYWISSTDLRRFISKLVNLKDLYAIDTTLGLTDKDLDVYSDNTNLRKLAVTFKDFCSATRLPVPSIKVLYINIITPITHFMLCLLIRRIFPGSKKIWLDLALDSPIHCLFYPIPAHSLASKVVYRIDYCVRELEFNEAGLTTYYSARRTSQPYIVCAERLNVALEKRFDKVAINDCVASFTNNAQEWMLLYELHCSLPYGPKDAKKILLWQNNRNDRNQTGSCLEFEELNFDHRNYDCKNLGYSKSVRSILNSPNAKNLKKLSMNPCLFICHECQNTLETSDRDGNVIEFKRRRVGIGSATNCNHDNPNFFHNLIQLKVLEVFDCESPQTKRCAISTMFERFNSISLLENLTSLTVEVPLSMDGIFLIKILTVCKRLQVLKVESKRVNETLNFNLCLALEKSHSLKDLRFENPHMPIDRLIESLGRIPIKRLERLVLICRTIDKFSAQPFKDFLYSNPLLIFLYISIKEGTEAFRKKAQATLNEYKKGNSMKIFHIEKKNIEFKKGFPIPDFHYREMINCKSQVSMMDASEDFSTF